MPSHRTHISRSSLLPLFCLLAVTFAVYGRILGHGFLQVWDDNAYVTNNPDAWGISWAHVRSAFSRYYVGNYAPVQILSYMLDYGLWGLRPGGFLLTNIVIHAANGMLLYRLLRRWYVDRCVPLCASALFLLHPVQVESVAWVSQRKNLLAIFFFLLAWEGYCRYREAPAGRGKWAYAASLVAFVLSLLAKSMTVVMPIVLVLFDLCFPGETRRVRFRDKVPYLIAAGIVGAVACISQRPELGGGRTGYHGGTPWATFLTMLPVFCRYLGMLVWPANLSAEYAPTIHRHLDAAVAGAALLLTAIALAGWRLWRLDRRPVFWGALFWIGLLPVAQIVPLVTLMNDRYLYLPMIGAATLAGHGLSYLMNTGRGRYARLVATAAVMLVIVLSVVSFRRAGVWQNSLLLWNDAVSRYPASDRAWGILADAYRLRGDTAAVRSTYERALAYDPENPHALNGLGNLYTEQGEPEKGYAFLQRLLKSHPRHAVGWVSLGDNCLKRGDYPQAESAYKKALEIQPGAVSVYLLLGNLAVVRHRLDEARRYYRTAEGKGTNDPGSAYGLARVAALEDRRDAAFAWLEKALQRGYGAYDELYNNRELSALWGDPRFNYLLMQYFPDRVGGAAR